MTDSVLVQDLDNGDSRLIAVFGLGVRVDVREQVVRIFLLQLDNALIVEREALDPIAIDLLGVVDAIAFLVIAADVEVEIHVDPVLLQLGDQEVEPVELLRIEGAGIVFAAVGNAGGRPFVYEVQPNDVDAIPRQSSRPHGRVLFGGKLDRARAPVGEMDAPEADPFAIGLDEVAALHADEAVLSGGRVVEEGEVCR